MCCSAAYCWPRVCVIVCVCVHSGGERVRDNDAKKESEGKSNVEGLKRARLCNHCKSSRLRVRPQKQHGQS